MEQFVNSSRTTLNGAIDDSQTSIVVTNSTGFPTSGNFRIRIDAELLLVTAVSGNTWTVTRAIEPVQGVQIARAHIDKSAVAFRLTAGSLPLVMPAFDAAGNLFIGGGGTLATRFLGTPGNFDDLGCDNIGIGAGTIDDSNPLPALSGVTDGKGNIGIGGSALSSLTTGKFDVAIGENVATNMTTGRENIAIGDSSLDRITTGNNNVGVGGGSLSANTTGAFNSSFGYSSGGTNASFGPITGCTFLGAWTTSGKDNLTAGIAIGAFATVYNNNQCVIGTAPDDLNGDYSVCLIWSGSTAPADADLVAGQCAIYFDFTNGAPLMKAKGKTLDGTVYNKTLTWV